MCQNLNLNTLCSLLGGSLQSRSTRTAPKKELIMGRIAERHPSHAQNTSSISLSSTHSDTTARFLHESAHPVTLAPISVLPPEVLARIFHLVSLAESSRLGMGILRWTSITHVCRHWRQVALDDSSLWARISGWRVNTTWIAETLARARNAPLAIDLFEMPNAETLSMFAAHFAHTHEFRLRGLVTPHFFDDNIREICSLEAPALEHFELDADNDSPVTFFRAPLFNGMAPKLRTFSLSQIYVPWSLIPCGQLSQLKISLFCEGEPIADGPSFGDLKSLIDLLINCPVLEILDLESCLPQSITRPSHVQAIHLPRLSHLSLRDSSSRVANLLEILRLPSSTTLRMRCTYENTATNNDRHLLPLVSAHFHDPASVEIKSFTVTLDHVESLISFAAYTYLPTLTTHPSNVFEGDLNGGAALVLSFNKAFEAEADILGQVCNMLPISNIEFLSICAPNMVRYVNWGDLFQRCAKLTTIEANGHGASVLLEEFTPPKPKKAPPGENGRKRKLDDRGVPVPASSSHIATAGTPVPIFPKLTSLLLRNLKFFEPAHRPGALYEVLSTMLQQRKAFKVPLKMLRIDDCFIATNRANALGELVPEFVQHGCKATSLDQFDNFGDLSEVSTEDQWTIEEWEKYCHYCDGW
ncbi:hypothetical protein BC826DRAFT_631337 [Russula brevipes]|nr:hypothetical protein BC826DRAFT_631337 [Russula brevipes]